ncbi:MAG: peptide chain release factor N(5)-glutamine methyltransferase [Pseudomonadota bacterium]
MSQPADAHLRQATDRLADAGVETPARDARLLMRWALRTDGAGLALHTRPLNIEEQSRFEIAVARRVRREPLSHITGTREFWGREFEVTADVLDPRPETECLIAEALHRGPFRKVLDLGTGSGCILLTLLAEWPDATGMGSDLSPSALEVAHRNMQALGVQDRAQLILSDWGAEIRGVFDLIVSNPPYIAEEEMPNLSPEVRNFESTMALTPGGDGLAAYETIANLALRHLAPNGLLMVEIGPTQSLQVSAIFANAGLMVQSVLPDLDQRARVVVAHP